MVGGDNVKLYKKSGKFKYGQTKRRKMKTTYGEKVFTIFLYLVLTFSLVIVLFPLIQIVSSSFSNPKAVQTGRVFLLPVDFTLKGYQAVFENKQIMTGFMNSFIYMFGGTFISLIVTVMAAYPLSRRELKGKKWFTLFFVFTMLFNGGMIPSYLLLKNMHLLNTRWSILLASALSVWNMIVMRSYYENNIPDDLYEAAYLDGAGDFQCLLKIVLPLSGPIFAVICLYYAIGQWNSYFNAMIYLRNQDYFPLQIILRNILIQNQMSGQMIKDATQLERMQGLAQLLKYSVMVVSCLPLVIIYPFVQKFIVKGTMVGAVKG